MMRRLLVGVAIALLVAGSVAFAQDQGRTVKYEYTIGWGTVIGPCGDAVILSGADLKITWIDRYDQDGTLIQSVINIRTASPAVYFLAESPDTPEPLNDRRVMGVPGEVQTERIVYAENRAYVQGSIFQATVPHYGRIFSETGHTALELPFWTPLSDSGHDDSYTQDFAALCAYLSQ